MAPGTVSFRRSSSFRRRRDRTCHPRRPMGYGNSWESRVQWNETLLSAVSVSVNVSPRHITNGTLAADVEAFWRAPVSRHGFSSWKF